MRVLVFPLDKVIQGILAHVDVGVDVSLDHCLDLARSLLEERLYHHDARIVEDKRCALARWEEFRVLARGYARDVELDNLGLDLGVDLLCFFSDLFEPVN